MGKEQQEIKIGSLQKYQNVWGFGDGSFKNRDAIILSKISLDSGYERYRAFDLKESKVVFISYNNHYKKFHLMGKPGSFLVSGTKSYICDQFGDWYECDIRGKRI